MNLPEVSKNSRRSCQSEAKGFTLIELMVAISIIALLSIIALSAFSSVQKSSRDAKRKSDLGTVRGALEQYRADQHNYPVSGNVGIGNLSSYLPDKALTNPAATVTYLNKYPRDPKYSTGGCSILPCYKYYYQALPNGCNNTTTTCNSYCLFDSTESNGNATMDPACSNAMFNYSITAP